MKKALITGVTGQDGAYLSRLLLDKGYCVYGIERRLSTRNHWRLKELGVLSNPEFNLIDADLTDLGSLIRVLQKIQPDEVYNLAAQSFVAVSFDEPASTADITGVGTLRLLEAIRLVCPCAKFYQASTSELYGKVQEIPQTETTPFYPRSPYAVSKLYAHWITVNYRESYGLFGACGILFNHESPLRGTEFVTRKITKSVAEISLGHDIVLELGNLNAKRDWGYAGDYVEGMWLMLQQEKPDTYVLATNVTTTVREFVKLAFSKVGIDIAFEGTGDNEIGRDVNSGRVLVTVNPAYYRPAEVDLLIGNPEKAKNELGWVPKVGLNQLCEMMVRADIARITNKKLEI